MKIWEEISNIVKQLIPIIKKIVNLIQRALLGEGY